MTPTITDLTPPKYDSELQSEIGSLKKIISEFEKSTSLLTELLAEAHGNTELLLQVLECYPSKMFPPECRAAIQAARAALNYGQGCFMAHFGDSIGGANPQAN